MGPVPWLNTFGITTRMGFSPHALMRLCIGYYDRSNLSHSKTYGLVVRFIYQIY